MQWGDSWPAPAKINLFLHVVGRRADGYHLLQTVFRLIDRADTLRFEPRGDGRIVASRPLPGVAADADLTVRAANALQAATGIRKGVTIHLEKRLPLGGGLGGGSSDAATTLIALNRLWKVQLDSRQLQQIGLTLGADVPFFVYGRTAFAEGIGECFTDVTAGGASYLVLVPPVAVPTPTIFRAPDLRRNTPAIVPDQWQEGFGGNDLEPVACNLFPEVARHLSILRQFGTARMSGSGACCYAAFPDHGAAQRALAACPPDVAGFVASGLDRHPLLTSQS